MAELPAAKWEYKRVWGRGITEEFLNKFGEEGWELVIILGDGAAIFKRPKLEQQQPDVE